MPALLEKAAVIWMKRLEALEGPQRVRNSAEVALAYRQQVQDVPVFRDFCEECVGAVHALHELAFLHQSAQASHLKLDP
jgi:hypothetical protein